MIKAVLLAMLTGDLPCLAGEEAGLGLFAAAGGRSADREPLAGLVAALAARGRRAEWLQAAPGKTLCQLIAANLRYAAADRAAVIFAAVEEAILRGHTYCFNGIGDLSRAFVGRYRAVGHEVHKMTGFVRFHPAADGALVARPKLFHNTADLILRQFASRYPGTRLVFLLEDTALVLDQGRLGRQSANSYTACVDADPFAAAWEKYYRSQYIETRKNIALASRCLPKKYWDWLAEGRILAAEAKN